MVLLLLATALVSTNIDFYERQVTMSGNYGRGPHNSKFSCNVSAVEDDVKSECSHTAQWGCFVQRVLYATSSAAGGSSDGFAGMLLSPMEGSSPYSGNIGELTFWQSWGESTAPKNVTIVFQRWKNDMPNEMTLTADGPPGLPSCFTPDKDDPAPRVKLSFTPTQKPSLMSVDLAPLGPVGGLKVFMAPIPCTPGTTNTGCFVEESLFIGDFAVA